jgi:hypothetical protein
MIKFSLALLAFSIVSVLFITSAHKDKEIQMTAEIYSACKEKGVYVFADSTILKCSVH